MPRIFIVDDDYAMELLAERLRFAGVEVTRVPSATEAMRDIKTIARADLIILDIIMQQPANGETPSITGDSTTGMKVLAAIRKTNPAIPVLVFSATNDSNVLDALTGAPHTEFISKWSGVSLKELLHPAFLKTLLEA